MYKTALLLLVFSIAILSNTLRAENARAEFEVVRSEVSAARQATVADYLALTDDKAEAFWPMYRQFRLEWDALADQRIENMADFYDSIESLSNEKAKKFVDDYIAMQGSKLQLQKAHLDQVRRILPERKVLQYFQIEHMLSTVVEYELIEELPLVDGLFE